MTPSTVDRTSDLVEQTRLQEPLARADFDHQLLARERALLSTRSAMGPGWVSMAVVGGALATFALVSALKVLRGRSNGGGLEYKMAWRLRL